MLILTGCFHSPACEKSTEVKALPRKTQFLDLPREIRDIIYSYSVQSHTNFVLFQPSPKTARPWYESFYPVWSAENCYSPTAGPSIAVSLLQTCRQIRLEASRYFYALNTFICYPPLRQFKFMQNIEHIWIDGYTADLRGRHVWPESIRRELEWVRGLPELKTVRLSLVRRGSDMYTLFQSPSLFDLCMEELRQDRVAWDNFSSEAILDHNTDSAKKRQVRRILDVVHPDTTEWGQSLNYAVGITQLHEAWGGELWFCNSIGAREQLVDYFVPGGPPPAI